MRASHGKRSWQHLILASAGIVTTAAATGCQVDIGGQTLPSGYYQSDDVQYFPPGAEFKLSKEAAAQKAYKEEAAREAKKTEAGPIRR